MSYIGKEQSITVGGKTYTLSRYTLEVRKEFAEWVASHIADPLETAAKHIDKFPPELQKVLVAKAWEAARNRLDIEGPEVQMAMGTLEGHVKLTQLLLKKHHPDISEEQAFDISQDYFQEQLEKVKARIKAEKPETDEDSLNLEAMEVLKADSFRPLS